MHSAPAKALSESERVLEVTQTLLMLATIDKHQTCCGPFIDILHMLCVGRSNSGCATLVTPRSHAALQPGAEGPQAIHALLSSSVDLQAPS